jgi:dihydroflavonol-4-reductase
LSAPPARARQPGGFPGELVEGDARDEASMARALTGVGTLFHVAADYRLWAPDPEEIVRNNLNSTGTVMRAAQAAGSAGSSIPAASPR